MGEDKDLYAILGLRKGASADEIRKAYRSLARQYHPDVNPNNAAAEERFKEISAAYETLNDTAKRKLYDEFGSAGLRDGFDAQRARAYSRWAQGQGSGGMGAGAGVGGSAGFGGQGFEFDLSDLFGDMFSGAKRGGGASMGRGRDLSATVDIDFAQALSGCEVRLQMPASGACGACHGTGRSGRSGCQRCGGSGRAQGSETLTVRIPKGADHGSKLRVGGRGEPGALGGTPGDLIIETRIRPHPHFRRDGLHLILRLPVTVDEAYNGAVVQVPTPTGSVSLRVPMLSQAGTILRLKGKGVERGGKSGDLLVELDVRLPDSNDKRIAESFKAATAGYKKAVRGALRL